MKGRKDTLKLSLKSQRNSALVQTNEIEVLKAVFVKGAGNVQPLN